MMLASINQNLQETGYEKGARVKVMYYLNCNYRVETVNCKSEDLVWL